MICIALLILLLFDCSSWAVAETAAHKCIAALGRLSSDTIGRNQAINVLQSVADRANHPTSWTSQPAAHETWARAAIQALDGKAPMQQCVMVGSSPMVLGLGLGPAIEAIASGGGSVWRFNEAPTEGYELDVGSHTTYRVIGRSYVTRSSDVREIIIHRYNSDIYRDEDRRYFKQQEITLYRK